MIKRLLLFFVLITSLSLKSQSFNRPVPVGDVHPYEYLNYNSSKTGYYLMSPFYLPSSSSPAYTRFSYPCVVDSKGYIYWYMKIPQTIAVDFKYHPENKVFSYNSFQMNTGGVTYFEELNQQLFLTDSTNPVAATFDNHEYKRLPNGNYLLSAKKDSLMDLSSDTLGNIPGTTNMVALGYLIQELDSNKNLLFEWNSNDYIHPTEMNDDFANLYTDSASLDYAHGNSIDKDSDGNYYISLRHTNCIYKIDTNGNIVWRLGGKLSDFTFTNDAGFSGQHDARILTNGNISLYDNANTSINKESRGVIYSLDTNTWTATKVKEISHTDSVYARAMGGFYQASNKDQILNYGLLYRPAPSVLHFDSNDNLVSEFYFKDSVMSYRTFYYEQNTLSFLPQQPTISCYDTTILAKKLVAPNGYDTYRWSNGDTSKTIIINQSGEYQVWVNYGNGMLGTKPITIDITAPCNSVGIPELNNTTDKVIAIYNLLGKRIERAIPNQVNIYQYESGQVKKVIPIIE